jgi:molybdate/tungstate transport system substrate-binding protein
MNAIFRVLVFIIIVAVTAGFGGCLKEAKEKTPLKVYAAGSLVIPFGEAEQEFEALHPGVDVQVEPHGSIQVIRQVTDLHRPGDVIAVADESLIPDLMYRHIEGSSGNYSDGYAQFGRNEMVIAYTQKSRYSSEITPDNWYEVLARPDVKVGLSNPMLDAAGYRGIMVVKLAEAEYADRTLFSKIIGDHFDPPLKFQEDGSRARVTLPEVMKPSDEHLVIRDGSIYLLSLLETGGIDYAFEYRSVAGAKNLSFVTLPGSVNLGSGANAPEYRNVTVVLGFQRFSSIGRERTGMPIVYAICVPRTATNPGPGEEFAAYIVNESGKCRPGWPAPLNRT